MILAHWRARRANRKLIDQIHGKIVAAARRPALYADLGVPDTFDGRFEMVTLHAGLVMRRLMKHSDAGAELAHELADSVFRHFDVALREMGLGDIAVAKRLKRMAEAFYGRKRPMARLWTRPVRIACAGRWRATSMARRMSRSRQWRRAWPNSCARPLTRSMRRRWRLLPPETSNSPH